jgi:hypothetical protein
MSKMKHGQYRPEDLEQAVSKVKQGTSLRKASHLTGVPVSTIKDHAREKYMDRSTRNGGMYALTDTEETALTNYVQYMGERGFPLNRKVVKRLATDIAQQSGGSSVFNMGNGPSNKWVRRFLKRHPQLSLRTPHPLEKNRAAVSNTQIQDYYTILDSALDKLGIKDDPTRIYNFDESGFSGRERAREKIVVTKGTKHPYQPLVSISGHITLNLAISAAGKTCAPLLIFSKNLPRNDFSDGIPDDWSFSTTKSGYINSEIFLSWFRDCFVKQCGRSRPILVVMDNHSTHLNTDVIDLANKEQIELLCLPAHSTHLLQPLDVGYYHLLKTNIANLSTALGYTGMKSLPRHKFPKLLHLAMNKISGSDVSAAFSVVGLCPFNSLKVKLVEDKPPQQEKNQESTEVTIETKCETCGLSTVNPLVRMGLIPEELQHILVEPPKKDDNKGGSRRKFDKARVITAVELKKGCVETSTAKQVDEKEKATTSTSVMDVEMGESSGATKTTKVKGSRRQSTQKKSKTAKLKTSGRSKTEEKRPEREDDMEVDDVLQDDDGVLCEICMTPAGLRWIGCDNCEKWIHYECVDLREQKLIDHSLAIPGVLWLCNVCKQEE